MKIGVWNTAFLGDSVLTLPLLATLRANYPEAEIHYWVRAGLEALFTHQPEIDAVHAVSKRGGERGLLGAWKLGRRVAREEYDLWISTHASFRSGLVSMLSSLPRRVGYSKPWYNHYFYTRTVNRRFPELHEVDRLLQLCRALDVSTIVDKAKPVPAPEAVRDAAAFWEQHVTGKVVGVHPGSVWPSKRWPAESYGRLMSNIVDSGAQVMLFAGPGEEGTAAEALQASGLDPASPMVLNVSGSLSLPQLTAWIARLDCYVTNDSGPMHLAWMQDVPVVAIFGPTTEDLGFFPRGDHSIVLEYNLNCRPCGLHGHVQCPEGAHECMTNISVEAVWEAVAKKLRPSA